MSEILKSVDLFKNLSPSPYRTCQWPFGHPGEEGFHFCGEATFGGFSYCREHVARAYRVPEPKRSVEQKRSAA